MKYVAIALLLTSGFAFALADEPAPAPKTFTLTNEQATDYARRLQAENEQLTRQYQANVAALKALQDQLAPAAPKKKEAK